MARNYPRFLYSNPQNTKSKGPFIVHTLYPKAVFRVNGSQEYFVGATHAMHGKSFSVILLDIDHCSDELKMPLTDEAYMWFKNQPEAAMFM
jgi:hypothetical protein